MKESTKFQSYQFKGIKTIIIYIIVLLVILAAATGWNLSNAATPSDTQRHWILFLICFVVCDIVLVYIGRMPLWVSFTQDGIITKGFYRAKSALKWDEIREAGVLISERGQHLPFLYLTKNKLTSAQRADINILSTMKNTVTLQATPETIKELRKYYTGEIEKEALIPSKTR